MWPYGCICYINYDLNTRHLVVFPARYHPWASALADHVFKQDRVLRPKVAMFVVDEGHNILKVTEKLTQGLDAKGCFWSEPRPKE